MWYGEQRGDQPCDDDQLNGPGQFGHALCHERVTDGYVPFGRKRGYGEHGGVGRHLGEQSSKLTEYLAKYIRIPMAKQRIFKTEQS